ncbi:hypothetical protein NDU88_004500 [Pleurodeles waltl]|uniref:Gypsy retrotransposon integrase-like protein 1 n=1 Tax=Pleurodeles waltl TaxID=8319 RepID=A0AAV7T8P1_PLEWA|nr:hypothetical protein NDU88_004500 [Pleurodeles waltl]
MAEVALVSLGGVGLATLPTLPKNMENYSQRPSINGTEVEALRGTGASVNMVIDTMVSQELMLPGVFHHVTYADSRTKLHPMAKVDFEWGGVTGSKKVAVPPALPVQCLLENDIKATEWSEVERGLHMRLLELTECVCAVTRSLTTQKGKSGYLDPGMKGQASMDKGTGPGEPAQGTPEVQQEPDSDGEDLTSEDGTPSLPDLSELAELTGASEPSREEFCQEQRGCPTLEGLNQIALKQEKGDDSVFHMIYWEDGLLYAKARNLREGATKSLVMTQKYKEFILTLSHDIPLAGHLGQCKTWNWLVNHFYWPHMSQKVKQICSFCVTCQDRGKTGGIPKAPLIPLPVVGTPFERGRVNLVSLLEIPTASEDKYILVVVDHATRYPEAIPLRTIAAPVAVRALLGVFTRVGFPKEAVSDRRTNFLPSYLNVM